MDVEKELAKLYEAQKPMAEELTNGFMRVTTNGGVYIAAGQIDLLANLTVERLKKVLKIENEE